MTRKNYIEIAEMFSNLKNVEQEMTGEDMRRLLISNISHFLAKDNPNFDYNRFHNACEAQPKEI